MMHSENSYGPFGSEGCNEDWRSGVKVAGALWNAHSGVRHMSTTRDKNL